MRTSPRERELLGFLDASPPAWVLTPTRRLAHTLRLRIAQIRAAGGTAVAETPSIHCVDDWLIDLGRAVLAREVDGHTARPAHAQRPNGRVLLAPAAEALVWEKVIAKISAEDDRELMDTASLATTAAQAWERICTWGEPPWSGPLAEDAEAFRSWVPEFRTHLEHGGFVTAAELPRIVVEALAGGALDDRRPADVIVLGFERVDPALRRILDCLRSRGTTVHEGLGGEQREAAGPRAWCAPSQSAEIRSVAARIRRRLLEDPDLRIAVLAPDLPSYGKRLERIFEEELDPAGVLAIGNASGRRFDYAESPALADYPLIAGALDVLSLVRDRAPFETVSRILLSVHPRDPDAFAAGTTERERALRGAVEAGLRRERSAVLHLSGRESSVATRLRNARLEAAARRFENLAGHLRRAREALRSPTEWRSEWIERLGIAGWPGRLVGEAEGLVFRRWRDALDDFAMLEAVEPAMREHEALARLRAICTVTRVQPASSGPAVQVMNLLDSAGLEFDVIFAIGMTSTAFPPPPRPNPLLPVAWQRAQPGMPRASVEGERELAEIVWSRMLRSAPEVWTSYPAIGDGDQENSPSAFVAAGPVESGGAAEAPWWLEAARSADAREERPADIAGPARIVRGGSSIIAHQSDCPFRAFAVQRLGAERLGAIQQQPDSSRRGVLVHAALEKAYSDIPSSDELAGLSDENIDEVGLVAADHAIRLSEEFFEDAPDLADATRHWLQQMVAAWMRHERDARTGAWVVDSREQGFECEIPFESQRRLTISFRPDRIDRIEDGSIVILDFKTSASPKGPSLWKGERPAEPQLPLYSALLARGNETVGGIAFANLSARDKCELQGVAAHELAARLKPPAAKSGTYADVLASWRTTVEALAASYLEGDVRTDPRDARVCELCGGQSLCRIRESGTSGDGDEEDDSE